MQILVEGSAADVALGRLEPADCERLRRLFERLSPETRYRRFLSPIARCEQAHPEVLLDLDHRDREAVVAAGEDGEIVGVARYSRTGPAVAEVAVVVADGWQRRGIARRMLTALAGLAAEAGIGEFAVVSQPDNGRALGLIRHLSPDVRLRFESGLMTGRVRVGTPAFQGP